MDEEPASSVQVERVRLRGPGAVILTGPSRARAEAAYASRLAERHQVSDEASIFDCVDSSEELTRKVQSHVPALEAYFGRSGMASRTSQLEWLEFCTRHGLLVPNRWTQEFVAAHLESTAELRADPFILDGYPRTVTAAEHLVALLRGLGIPIIKVLHLSISKQEMLSRARLRRRADDDEASLRSRYEFYVEKVQPSVDYLKVELGSQCVALIDAHQPVYRDSAGEKRFDLAASIANVAVSALRALGVPGPIARDLTAQAGAQDR
jgi:adenylate kinase family enzyme